MPGRPVSQNRCAKCQCPCVHEYCFRHKPSVKDYVKNYYQTHADKMREQSKAYYQAHREEVIKRVTIRQKARNNEIKNIVAEVAVNANAQPVQQVDNIMTD